MSLSLSPGAAPSQHRSLQLPALGGPHRPGAWSGHSFLNSLTYRDKFVIICLNIFEYGLAQQEKRRVELDTFNACVQEAVQENREQGKLRIARFEEKHLLVGLTPAPAPPLPPHRAVALSL